MDNKWRLALHVVKQATGILEMRNLWVGHPRYLMKSVHLKNPFRSPKVASFLRPTVGVEYATRLWKQRKTQYLCFAALGITLCIFIVSSSGSFRKEWNTKQRDVLFAEIHC